FANRHAMPHRDRELADERLEAGGEHRAFHGESADRVRPIADDRLDAMPSGGAKTVGHRIDVGVDAGSDVLEIDHQRVNAPQHVGGRLPGFAVQRIAGHPAGIVAPMPGFDHVLWTSEWKPCCGPKMAARRPGHWSATCRKRWSTEAGLQTRPTAA